MIPIIITSIAIVFVFIVLLITAIILFVNLARKNDKKKRDLTIVIISGVIFFSLIGLDAYLITSNLQYSKEKAREIALDAAETTGQGFVVTYDAAKKKWDDRSVEKLKNIDISISQCTVNESTDQKSYEVKIIFDNKNSTAESMSLDEMVALNYLMFTDQNDIVHAITEKESETTALPMGKSEATLIANVDKDVDLKYLRFVDRKIPLN